MRLNDYKKDFYEFSAKASDAARSAAFAGIALVWVFKLDAKPIPHLPRELLAPAGLFALGLASDLLQYVVGTGIWGAFHLYNERRLRNPQSDPQLSHPVWLPVPVHVFFVLKVLAVVVGYLLLGVYVWRAWHGVSP